MPEIKTCPLVRKDESGDDVVCFTVEHTLSDIVRWIMENRVDAEEVYHLLGMELEKPERLS